ncbi:putative Zn-dependent peptidase [Solibacillus kalamii]|uniref:Predicted Zn-dependent peptidase n=3 Tax=Solibacillus TaxID=648800 RepID=F2F2Q3_SOLSS|nr:MULTISPECIES: pitrilysin family protein [Solibacillus]AMO84759.1 zinc protease [Solibacillus silvestris]EKB46802.1 Peptidase M16 inactive domain protein [Solibacillus isronensis B3W22]MBM7665234.1 putative Zn-dependent peptidase [Solibacillus kalamii]OBW58456.1 zinc protease [Solibacillus silvestris]OUZ40406.1 peptidase M16 [Solibacillus kalamii]
METIEFQQLDETLYYKQLNNGLDVYILPKKGFSKTFVTFTTKYGSIDRTFVPIGETEPVTVPDGIAHFLEHKMFEKEDGDVFQKFSEVGAQANAFTSFTRTAYLFSATDHIYKSTETLLNFVQEPYFTEETVNKEKGIIGQEITMYDDQPDWRLYFGAIENMYHNHPVKIDIAGTIESIDGITAEHLYTCYNTFYHPSNMLLFVIGAVDPVEMMAFIEDNQNKKTFQKPTDLKRLFDEEPTNVAEKERVLHMDVQKPKVYVGLKAKQVDLSGEEMLKHELAVQIGVECLFGRASSFYTDVYENGLIDESYGYDFSLENGYGFALIGSDSEQPEQLAKLIKEKLAQSEQENLFTSEDVERIKRKKIGFFLRALNSIEFIANQFTRYKFNDMNLFDVVPVLETITVEDIVNAFKTIQGEEQQTVFTIMPVSGRDQK